MLLSNSENIFLINEKILVSQYFIKDYDKYTWYLISFGTRFLTETNLKWKKDVK